MGNGSFKTALRSLASWFERQKRVLPWRDDRSLYRVWVSEIMLQQTQVATVVPYFERFIGRFPTVESLASAPVEDVLLQWAGLGYYSRARNLHRAAQMIVERGAGDSGFPRDREGWLEIPGVGQYTAGAILSIALDQPEAILDGNVERVLSRVRRVGRAKGDAAFKGRLWRLSRIFVERAHGLAIAPHVLNQSLMELGATICTPKKPACLLCPIADFCRARQAGEAEAYPPRRAGKKWLEVQERLHLWIDTRGHVLLRQRLKGEWRAGLWDLLDQAPGEGAELLGSAETKHIVTRHRITRSTQVWRVKPRLKSMFRAEENAASSSAPHRWIDPVQPGVAVGSALKATLRQIRERFPEAWPED